jgi:hypothetical protein
MSNRKQRREIDKAVQHLMQFPEQHVQWAHLFEEFLSQMFAPLANRYEAGVEDAEDQIMQGYYSSMAFGYLFEEFATAAWDEDDKSMLQEYLQQRGWREGAHGRRYLRALSTADLKLWEVVDVKPGVAVDIRLYDTQDKPIRVMEQSASESLHQWDCLAARVLRVDGRAMFAGGMLNFSPAQAGIIQRTLASSAEMLKDLLSAAQETGELEELPADLDAYISSEIQNELADVAFTVWASGIIDVEDRPLPQLFNSDDEPIELTRLRFPVTGNRHEIEQALNHSPVLADGMEDSWAWYPKPVEEIAEDERVSIHGHIWLNQDALELEVNSTARAARGKAFIQSLLGQYLGEPLTVHENLEKALEESDFSAAPDPMDLNAHPEVQALLQAQLTAHYRETLDEPIPMLNGKTPRACAADPQTRHEVIEWLKYLENTDQHSPQSAYDFGWMWEELGIDRK